MPEEDRHGVARIDSPRQRKARASDPASDGLALLANGKYVHVNVTFAHLLGYRPEELIGRSWHLPYSERTVSMIEQHVLPRLLSMHNSRWRKRIRAVSKGGGRRDLEVRWLRGEDRTILCIARPRVGPFSADVISRLRSVNRSQRDFLAVVSHELRTPLSGILGAAELLKPVVGGRAGSPQAQLLEQIEASAAHLTDLIGDVLDLSSVAAGRMQAALRPVCIVEICSQSIALLQSIAQAKGLAVELEIDPALSHVRAEPRRLRQMLINLLSNAVKFTPSAHPIGLCVTRSADETRAVFEVWDSGPGLTEAQIAELRAFVPYTQLEQPRDDVSLGAGLGLSIVKRLVDLHAGSFSIHGEPGTGCRFRIEIPLAPAEQAHEQLRVTAIDPPPANLTNPAGTRVLLVDDVAANTSITAAYLTRAGFQVLTADSARRALDLLSERTVDVLICDVRMPDMDGVELARQIRSGSRHPAVPIVAFTGSISRNERRRCLAAGVNEYLVKPLPLQRLATTIARLASRNCDADGGANPLSQHVELGSMQAEALQGDAREALVLHDIHDSLGAAIGNLDLALSDSAACLPETLRDALESCLRVADLLEQLRRSPRAVADGRLG